MVWYRIENIWQCCLGRYLIVSTFCSIRALYILNCDFDFILKNYNCSKRSDFKTFSYKKLRKNFDVLRGHFKVKNGVWMSYKCKKNNSSLKRKVTYKKYVTNFKTERLALIESLWVLSLGLSSVWWIGFTRQSNLPWHLLRTRNWPSLRRCMSPCASKKCLLGLRPCFALCIHLF